MEDFRGNGYNIRMRPMICEKCGYDLRGLPQRGGGPECGNSYDKDNFAGIAKPDNIYRKSETIAFWLKIMALVFGGIVIMGCSGVLSFFAKTPEKPLITGGVICGMMILIAIAMILLKHLEEKEQD